MPLLMVWTTDSALAIDRAVKINFAGFFVERACAIASPRPLGETPVIRTEHVSVFLNFASTLDNTYSSCRQHSRKRLQPPLHMWSFC